jgi:probable rRNA maturation factor
MMMNTPGMTRTRILIDEEGSSTRGYKSFTARIARMVLQNLSPGYPVELSVMLVDDKIMQKLNKEHRHKDSTTDVLAFPMKEGFALATPPGKRAYTLLGDIVISIETARGQAQAHQHPVKEEIALLVTHGILHLLGYRDETPEDSLVMDQKSREILKSIAAQAS